ncbi:MAG: MMPL family transporter [Nitrospinae bacterium]|nr:MMPL family transporter [Nitrospinota bacterium]
MATQGPGNDSGTPREPVRLLDRFFFHVERFAYTHSLAVIFVSLLVAGLSVWFTVENLTFKNNRGDLVAKQLPYVELYENYRKEFEDFDGMILVVEDENPQRMKGFAEAFVKKLAQHPEKFSRVFYKIDTDYFRGKGFLYLDRDELFDLGAKIRSHKNFLDTINAAPGLNRLVKSINAEISAGMVDSLLTGFLGTGEDEENEKDETSDLSLLIALEQQMVAHLQGDALYRSPWESFLTDNKESIAAEGYLVSGDEKLLFVLIVPNEDDAAATSIPDVIEFLRHLIEETRTQFPGVQVGLTGDDVIAADEMSTTRVDVIMASQIALTGVALLFILAYRGVVKPLLAIFSLVIALCWAMGWTTLVVGHLNSLTVVFTTNTLGVGTLPEAPNWLGGTWQVGSWRRALG